MTDEQDTATYSPRTNAFATLRDKIYIHQLPSYGNKIFFSLGFLALTCLVLLAGTGTVMAFMGQNWWLTNGLGIFFRSVHLWTVQAFIAILILHILVGVLTSGYRAPRRMVWVFGAMLFVLALIQTEFGYGLRGDFDSQYRMVSGADFWNGAYLGRLINPLDVSQSFALHVAIIPLTILLLFLAHYILERTYGISKPYRKDVAYKMVPADHRILFIRGGALVALIVTMAILFPSPFVPPVTIQQVVQEDPGLVAGVFLKEFTHTSDTATYLDSIDPYTYDTRAVYVVAPYEQYVAVAGGDNAWLVFENSSPAVQQEMTQQAEHYYLQNPLLLAASAAATSTNPVVAMIGTLVPMAENGLYAAALDQESPSINNTYTLRLLSDMGALEAKAASLHMTTDEWGMIKDETGSVMKLPPGSWWFAPLGILNKTLMRNSLNNDRGDATALGLVVLIFILFPYIPYASRIPERLNLAGFIWKTKKEGE